MHSTHPPATEQTNLADPIGRKSQEQRRLATRPTWAPEVVILAAGEPASELAAYLERNGVLCHTVHNPQAALRLVSTVAVDAAIVDSSALEGDGLEIVELLRRNSALAVIVLTSPGHTDARVVALEQGADDALSKPVSACELLARLRAILRRHRRLPGTRLTVGAMRLDLISRSASIGIEALELTPVEFDLLAVLARRAGRVVPRDNLLNLVGRTPRSASERAIDVHVSRLRKKVALGAGGRNLIASVRGVGYVLLPRTDARRGQERSSGCSSALR